MINEPDIWEDGPSDGGQYIVCPQCGKEAFMQQWLVDEKISLGYLFFCSHECGKAYYTTHPTEHPHTKKMLKQLLDGY